MVGSAIFLFDNRASKGKYWRTGQHTKLEYEEEKKANKTIILLYFAKCIIIFAERLRKRGEGVVPKNDTEWSRYPHMVKKLMSKIQF